MIATYLPAIREHLVAALKGLDAMAALLPQEPPAVPEPSDERARFARCLRETLRHEGGYVDHKLDPGGATNLGITLATAKAAGLDMDRDGDVDKADVRALTVRAVEPVYYERYWRAASCHILPPGVDLMVFDCAVNSGPKRAVAMLQDCLGVAEDGDFGAETYGALNAVTPPMLVQRYAQRRESFYRGLETFPTFGKGWIARLTAVTALSGRWA